MKNTLKFLSFFLITSCFFISCENNKNEENKYQFFNITIENGSNYDIDSVCVEFRPHSTRRSNSEVITLAGSKYNNGHFFLFLPRIIDEQYLINANEFFSPEQFDMYNENNDIILVSDTTAKILSISSINAYKNNELVGRFYSNASLIFTNKPFNIVGEYHDVRFVSFMLDKFDVYFNYGWNFFNHRHLITDIEDCEYCDEYDIMYEWFEKHQGGVGNDILIAEYKSNDLTRIKWEYEEIAEKEEENFSQKKFMQPILFEKPSYLKRR